MSGSAAEPTQDHSPPPRRRRRRGLAIAAIVLVVLGGLAAFAVYGPQAIARYAANSVLTGLDIDVEGVKTLRINLFDGTVALGPVRFRPLGEANTPLPDDAGQLGNLLVDLSLKTLWQRNALIRSAAITGIDIVIAREADGQIAINGIPLRRILAEEAADQPPPDAEKESWGTGVDLLTVRDSRLVFRDAARGTLEIAVSWLELDGFRSWEPDHPGRFTLIGDANGMRVTAWGQAHPFADNIRLRVESAIEEIAVPKIEAFAGPLPLTARDGTGRIDLRSRATLFADGRLEASTVGGIDIASANLAGEGWRFAAKTGRLGLDLAFDGATYASGRITGTIDLGLGGVEAGAEGAVSIGATDVKLNTSALTIDLAEDGGLQGESTIAMAVQGVTLTGAKGLAVNAAALDIAVKPVAVEMAADGSGRLGGGVDVALSEVRAEAGVGRDKLVVALAKLASQLADAGFDLAAHGGLAGQATIATAADGIAVTGAGGLAVKTGSLTLATQPMAVTAGADGSAKLTAAPKLTLASVAVSGPAEVTLAAVELTLEPLAVEAGEAMTVRTAGRLTARNGSAASGDVKAALADLGVALADVTLAQQGEQTKITGGLKATIGTPGIRVAASRGGPRARAEEIRVDARTFGLDAAPVSVAIAPAGIGIEGKAGVRLDDARVKLPEAAGGPSDVTLTRLAIGLDGARGRLGDAGSEVSGKLNVDLAGASAQLGMVHRDARAGFGTFTVALAPLDMRQDKTGWRVAGKGRVGLDRATGKLPVSDLGPFDSSLGSLAVAIANAEASGRGNALNWRVDADVSLRDIVAKVAGGRIADVDADRLTIDDLTGGDNLDFVTSRVALGALRASIARPKSKTAPRPVQEAAEIVAETREEIVKARATKEKEATVRIDRFRLDAPSKVRLNDPNVAPPVQAAIVVNRLDVDNFDTGASNRKMDVELAATINEFGKLTASGWLTPFADPPDFDLRAELLGLQLPPFSGLAANAVGVNIDSGRLRGDVKGTANAGQLSAQVDLTLAELAFGALSPEQAARASAAIGVPIETAVGLLKDNDGKITLSLPVSGDLKSPSFDLSGVIAKAVTGAVTSAVMAPFKLALAPVSLLAGALSAGSAPALTPIPFAAGSAELDAQGKGIVRGLVQVLKEREGLRLKVCGRATQADLEVLISRLPDRAKLSTDQMLEQAKAAAGRLAQERTLAARRAFVEGGSVNAERIGECRSAFDATDAGGPRVEVSL